MWEERLKYCEMDVDILAEAAMKYRDIIRKIGVDPFVSCYTLPSTAMRIFRCKHLKTNTIPLEPPGGYGMKEIQSIAAIK